MDFEKNTLLFGSDPTPRIVAIELGETGTVKVYRRERDGGTACDLESFILSSGLIRMWPISTSMPRSLPAICATAG